MWLVKAWSMAILPGHWFWPMSCFLFFEVEWTVTQSTGDEEQLFEKYTHVSIFLNFCQIYLLWSLSSIIFNLSKLYTKIHKNNSDSFSFNIYEEINQRYLICFLRRATLLLNALLNAIMNNRFNRWNMIKPKLR